MTFSSAVVVAPFIDDSASLPNTDIAAHAFGAGISGNNILLATLSFVAPDLTGLYGAGIISDLLDFNEGLLTFLHIADMTTSIDVQVNSAPIPEPGTIILLGFGLGGLAIFRRKNSLSK